MNSLMKSWWTYRHLTLEMIWWYLYRSIVNNGMVLHFPLILLSLLMISSSLLDPCIYYSGQTELQVRYGFSSLLLRSVSLLLFGPLRSDLDIVTIIFWDGCVCILCSSCYLCMLYYERCMVMYVYSDLGLLFCDCLFLFCILHLFWNGPKPPWYHIS